MIKNIFIESVLDPYTGVGVIGTILSKVVVDSQEVETMKNLGEFAPNNWSVFLPAIATTIFVLSKAFVLVRGHLLKSKREMDEHRQKMKG